MDGRVVNMQIVASLKGTRLYRSSGDIEQNLRVSGIPAATAPALLNGSPSILLFARAQGPISRQILLYPCGIVRLNDGNLEVVKRGINADEYPQTPHPF